MTLKSLCVKSVAVLSFAFILFQPTPLDESVPIATLRARRAQEILGNLRSELSIDQQVQIALVPSDPFVFSVKRTTPRKDSFQLSMELGFLLKLTDDELHAALAHELGHVWIFTHFPFLQTERLANDIGQRVVNRSSFDKLYSKLWEYEGTGAVPSEELLGPDHNAPVIQVAESAEELAQMVALQSEHAGRPVKGLDGAIYDPYKPVTIQRTQRGLRERGLYSGPLHGVLDSPTMHAIYDFQKASYHLQLCGVPTPRTRMMLEQGSHTDPGPSTR